MFRQDRDDRVTIQRPSAINLVIPRFQLGSNSNRGVMEQKVYRRDRVPGNHVGGRKKYYPPPPPPWSSRGRKPATGVVA